MRIVLLTLLLVGCGTTGSLKNPEETSYTTVTRYTASFFYKLFVGEVEGCKVSTHNMIIGESTILMDEDGRCTAEASSVSD